MSEVLVVLCTFPEAAGARQIGTLLVEKQLAACVNLIPGVESIYRWQDQLETSQEVMAVFKTTAAAWPEFQRVLASIHPYDVPEIIAIQPAALAPAYHAWVCRQCGP